MAELKDAMARLRGFVGEVTDVRPAALRAVGEFATSLIVLRTKQGIDADRQPFVAYTPSYAAARASSKLRTSPPDLVRTGHMLGAIVPVVGAGEVRLSFAGVHDAIKAAGNIDKRDFFDIRHEAELDAVAETFADELVGK